MALEFINARPGLKHDLKELFEWLQSNTVPHRPKRFPALTGLLSLHASCSREQVLLALGQRSFEQPKAFREGVLHLSDRKVDLFFADINKSEDDFSATTMQDDYAITDQLFHWQSQSQTSQESPTGQRYINHQEQGYTPLLFIRERKNLQNGLTAPTSSQGHSSTKAMKAASQYPLCGSWNTHCRPRCLRGRDGWGKLGFAKSHLYELGWVLPYSTTFLRLDRRLDFSIPKKARSTHARATCA